MRMETNSAYKQRFEELEKALDNFEKAGGVSVFLTVHKNTYGYKAISTNISKNNVIDVENSSHILAALVNFNSVLGEVINQRLQEEKNDKTKSKIETV